jgi:hypothetical protein
MSNEAFLKRAFWISQSLAVVPALFFFGGAVASDAAADVAGWMALAGLAFLPGLSISLWKVDKKAFLCRDSNSGDRGDVISPLPMVMETFCQMSQEVFHFLLSH